jgi:hypothetical protein
MMVRGKNAMTWMKTAKNAETVPKNIAQTEDDILPLRGRRKTATASERETAI